VPPPNAVPAEHRKYVQQVPEDVRDSLSPAELRLRCAEIARLHYTADATNDAQHCRYLTARARQVARSEPVCCSIEHRRGLTARLRGAPNLDEWSAVNGALREHKDKHVHPAGVTADVDQAFAGRASSPDALEIVAYHRAHHAG
jgi:hypothetical protein